MTGWTFAYDSWSSNDQPLREALCTLGNGRFCTRAAFEEARAGGKHYPGTYHAGGYDRQASDVQGQTVENEDLVNWPNWLPLSFRPEGGSWLDLDRFDVLAFRQTLEMRRGVLVRQVRVRDPEGRETDLTSQRIVHMDNPHLAAIHWTLVPRNWSGTLVLRSALDGDVTNDGVARYRALEDQHLCEHRVDAPAEDTISLGVRTRQSQMHMVQSARTRVFEEHGPVPVQRRTLPDERSIAQELRVPATEGRALTVEKIVAIHTTMGQGFLAPGATAERLVSRAGSFESLLESHERAWERIWRRCDLQLHDGAEVQSIVRLHVFHLLQAVSPHTIDMDVGVPARGLTGEAYRGHIFWDELFIFPFLNLRMPQITRALLMYRHRRLNEARHAAHEEGLRGALFPWQSGSDGREETQRLHLNPKSGRWLPDHTHLQRHVNAALAYNIWQYHQATGDRDFLVSFGAEMLVDIARLFSSLTTYDEHKDRYVIRGVVGPDEYHDAYPGASLPGLDNNAYTNVMATWVLRTAILALEELGPRRREELHARLALTDDEIDRFRDIARNMFVPFHGDGMIISQFEGYDDLEELDWEGLQARHGNIQRLDRILEAEGDTPNRYKAAKQADVLMLFYLFTSDELQALLHGLGYDVDPKALIPANIDYYSARTSHGSTLSRVVHSWVLARADRRSWECFDQALNSDVDDIQGGTTAEGIHLGAMAGTVDLIQRCYGGVTVHDGSLWIDPRLPDSIEQLTLQVRFRGSWLLIHVRPKSVGVKLQEGWADTVQVQVRGTPHTLERGEERIIAL
jgi:alpha,alpha-trehalase